MKFSIIYEAQMVDTSRASELRCFQETVEQSLYAEEMGFDTIWAVEHTSLSQYAHMSTPETFLAFLAGRTKRIHIGHGVVCLPFRQNHPIKVAERIAMLDILSEGRLHFGMGKGGTDQEIGAFGTPPATLQQECDEAMYMIPQMWKDGDFSYQSDLITIPPRPIWPKPFSDPHPPMYLASSREQSLIDAGSRGLGSLVLGFAGPEEIARKNEIYRKAFRERDPAKQVGFRPIEHLAALCPAVVLDDDEKARRIGFRGQRFFAEAIQHWYAGGPPPRSHENLTAEQQKREFESEKDAFVAFLHEEKIPVNDAATGLFNVEHAYGTPDRAIAYVQRLIDAGADEILFMFQMGTIPHEASMETIRNVGKYVIPHFRRQGSAKRVAG
jgi:alkanesulfonate monooxygenase SsuD/methylene tetrahydromethanopterin reductase-like flavin-dependent oxidoreductase (luciferase family)